MGDYLDQLSSFVCETKFKDLDEPARKLVADVMKIRNTPGWIGKIRVIAKFR